MKVEKKSLFALSCLRHSKEIVMFQVPTNTIFLKYLTKKEEESGKK
jgi:hypothetical protein